MKVIITIVGERGSGKTLLAQELLRYIRGIVQGSSVLGVLLRKTQFDLRIGSRADTEFPEEAQLEGEWHYLNSIRTPEA